MEALIPFAVIGCIIALVVAGIMYSMHLEKVRRESLGIAANELGLDYFETDPETEAFAKQFDVCNKGHGRKLYNVIKGVTDEVTIAIFDYRYTTGSGKNKTTHNQTIVSLQSAGLDNPSFTMRPEGFFDAIGGMLGFQDIDFDSHPNFSKMFVLKSPQEKMTRAFFNPQMLEFFEARQGVNVEANPGAMIFYRRGRSKPHELRDLFQEAYEVFGAMVDNSKKKI